MKKLSVFTQLIKDAQNGKINLVLTFNLHIITRDYSKLVDFFELMSEINDRFIAIEDDIDSEKGSPIPLFSCNAIMTEQ